MESTGILDSAFLLLIAKKLFLLFDAPKNPILNMYPESHLPVLYLGYIRASGMGVKNSITANEQIHCLL